MNKDRTTKKALSSLLKNLTKDELLQRDIFGRTIIHIICLCNRPDLLRQIFKNPNIESTISITDYENSWNCLHHSLYHGNLQCAKLIVDRWPHLLSAKDRDNITPLELLDNDFKSFKYFPASIGEKFEFKYRFSRANFSDNESAEMESPNEPMGKYASSNLLDDWWDPLRGGANIFLSTDDSKPLRLPRSNFKNDNTKKHSHLSQYIRFRDIKFLKDQDLVLTTRSSTEFHDPTEEIFGVSNVFLNLQTRKGYLSSSEEDFRFKPFDIFTESNMIIDVIDVSDDHVIALSTNGDVFTWGSNSFSQLGYQTEIRLSSNVSFGSKSSPDEMRGIPKKVFTGDIKKNVNRILGVACSNIHSLAFTSKEIFFWGLNVGQMGFSSLTSFPQPSLRGIEREHSTGSILATPTKTNFEYGTIRNVITCDSATIIVTENDELHLYHRHGRIKINIPLYHLDTQKHFDYFKPKNLTKKRVIKKVCMKSVNFICVLFSNGQILSFGIKSEGCNEPISASKISRSMKFHYLWKPKTYESRAIDMDTSVVGSMVICTRTGLVYTKALNTNKFRLKNNLNKICRVSCNNEFSRFGFIQDNVDVSPVSVSKSDLISDMNYLNVFSETDCFRQQTKLMKDRKKDSLTLNFVYPKKPNQTTNQNSLIIHDDYDYDSLDEKNRPNWDLFLEFYCSRFDHKVNKLPKSHFFYTGIHLEPVKQLLEHDEEYISYFLSSHDFSQKNQDYSISIKSNKILIHRGIFECRSNAFTNLFNSNGEVLYYEGTSVSNNKKSNELLLEGVNLKAALIFIHFIYTNDLVSVWDDSDKADPKTREVESQFYSLCNIFRIIDPLGRLPSNSKFLKSFTSLIDQATNMDVVIVLSDGEISCLSYVLICRSAYFESLLGKRWENRKSSKIELSHISKAQFSSILQFIYGYNHADIFSDLDSIDATDFINQVLALIEISDELLLFEFKDYCQLAIKDLLSVDNVLLLTHHAHNLLATKLLNCCLWFIYNNLEILLFSDCLNELPKDLLYIIEKRIKHFNRMRISYCEDINSVREFWMERISDSIVTDFVIDMPTHNSRFLHTDVPSNFQPLFDIKETKKVKLDIPESRKKENVTPSDTFSGSLQRKAISLSLDQAICDNDITAEEFIPVISGRRRRSSAKKQIFSAFSDDSNTLSILGNAESVRSKSLTNNTISVPSVPNLNNIKSIPSGVMGSNSTGSSLSLSRRQSLVSPCITEPEITPVATKITFGTPRLSQKERMKQNIDTTLFGLSSETYNSRNNSSSSEPSLSSSGDKDSAKSQPIFSDKFSWGKTSPTNSSRTRKEIQSSTKPTPSNTTFSGPSLTEIMLEEQFKIEEAQKKATERKSLADIQQEQEFAKWWEEECAKVQSQMQSMTVNSNDRPNNNKDKKDSLRKSRRTKSTSKEKNPESGNGGSSRDNQNNRRKKSHINKSDSKTNNRSLATSTTV